MCMADSLGWRPYPSYNNNTNNTYENATKYNV